MNKNKKKYLLPLRVLGWLMIVLAGLLLLVFIIIHMPFTQNILREKAEPYLKEKLNTEVRLGEIRVLFPEAIYLKDIYIEDQQRDTLIYFQSLKVSLDIFGLAAKKVNISSIKLDGLTAHIHQTLPDSSYNFDFIIQSFQQNGQENVEDTTESEWRFSLSNLVLKDIYFTLQDEVGGSNMQLLAGNFETNFETFDPTKQLFLADEIRLSNTSLNYVIHKEVQEEEEDTTAIDIQAGLNRLWLSKVDFTMENKVDNESMAVHVGETELIPQQINLPDQILDLKSLEIKNSHYALVTSSAVEAGPLENNEAEKDTAISFPIIPWSVSLGKLILKNNGFQMDDIDQPVQPMGSIDYNHLLLRNIYSEMNNIRIDRKSISADILQAGFIEKSGFHLQNLSVNFYLDTVLAELDQVNIRTENSNISNNTKVQFASWESIAENVGETQVQFAVSDSRIGFRDLLYFNPELSETPPVAGNTKESVWFNMEASGKVNDLRLENLHMKTGKSTVLRAQATAKGLPELQESTFNIKLEQLSSTADDIRNFLPEGTIPGDITLPPELRVQAFLNGTMDDFKSNLRLDTDFGSAEASLEAVSFTDENIPSYNGDLNIPGFELGKLLNKQDTLGMLSLTASYSGSGLTPEDLNAKVDLIVNQMDYNQYTYRDLVVFGDIKEKMFSGHAGISDSNLVFVFDGTVDFSRDQPLFDFLLNVKGADLQALNFSKNDIRLKGKIKSDITGSDFNNINGDFEVRDVLVIKEGVSYRVDSFLVASVVEAERTEVNLQSDMMSGYFRGTINLADLPVTLTHHINTYYQIDEVEQPKEAAPQNFDFQLNIYNTEFISGILLPQLKELKTTEIKGAYSSGKKKLNMSVAMPAIEYADVSIDTFLMNIGSDEDKLEYSLEFARIAYSDSFYIDQPLLSGTVKRDTIVSTFEIRDTSGIQKYLIQNEFYSLKEGFKLNFKDDLVLNYENWKFPENHYLLFKDQITAQNIALTHNGKKVALKTVQTTGKDSLLELSFDNFNLRTIGNMVRYRSSLVEGALNGELQFYIYQKDPFFTSDLKLEELAVLENEIGNLYIEANNRPAERLNIDLRLTGMGNEMVTKGYYHLEKEALNMDIQLEFNELSRLEPFTFGELTRLKGELEGDLQLKGTVDAPSVTGPVKFQNTSFNLTYLNSWFLLQNEKIAFSEAGITFPSFTIMDTLKNKAIVNGIVYTQDYMDYRFDVTVNTSDFVVMNTTEASGEIYYGKVIVDSEMKVSGNLDQPEVTMDAHVKEGTEFTFTVPEEDPAAVEQEGIVEFVDFSQEKDPLQKREEEIPDTIITEIRGINLTANVEISPEARLVIIVDPVTGDFLEMNGGGTLSYSMNPSGVISLAGTYKIESGNYQLTYYDLFKREFSIREGSTITWTGDPLEADINITAVYETRTAPLELVSAQLAGATSEEINRYKQKLPFLVYLIMEGELMQPQISFDIELPEDKKGAMGGTVHAKLQQLNEDQAALNKQVVGLLLLNSFFPEEPLEETGEGGVLGSIARSSVSNILTQQLNRLSEKYIKGVEIELGIESYEDYATGEPGGRTELEVGVKKELFDERVIVNVGGSLDVEGERRRRQDLSDFAGDVSVEYKITEDGTYRLKGFRKTEFEGLIEGEVVETGISLIFMKEYNKLKELFRKQEETLENGETKK